MLWEGLRNFCSLKKPKGNIFPMAPVMGNGTFPAGGCPRPEHGAGGSVAARGACHSSAFPEMSSHRTKPRREGRAGGFGPSSLL